MALFWIVLLVLVVVGIRWLLGSNTGQSSPPPHDDALEILKSRYARGEIDRQEFEQKKRDLLQ